MMYKLVKENHAHNNSMDYWDNSQTFDLDVSMNQEDFEQDPFQYLCDLLDTGIVSRERLLDLILCHMSRDDIKKMLDAEELSPRFLFEDEEDDGQPDEAQEWADYDPEC